MENTRTSRKRPPKIQGLSGLQESSHRGSLSRRGPGTSALWKIIYCMQRLSSGSMLSLKFFVYSK